MPKQHVHFARASDGVSVAYSTMGEGYPLLVINGWVSHLELDMENYHAVRFIESLADEPGRQVVRFDFRGTGLSDRHVEDLSVEARARDIEAVVDHLSLERMAIFAWSMNGPPAMMYAARHPEKVSHLILYGTFARQEHHGRAPLGRALVDLIRADWRIGSRALVEFEYPDADKDVADTLHSYHLASAPAEVAASVLEEALFRVDMRAHLPRLTMPTLVLHRRNDRAFPASCGRELAALLPHGHFVPLPGDVHLPFFGDTEAIVEAIGDFLGTGEPDAARSRGPRVAWGLQTILFTDMEGSTTLTQRLGDARAQEVLRAHNEVVRGALQSHAGSEIKHTGDGIMASFQTASGAIECAVAIQNELQRHNESTPGMPVKVRIGLNAGEPVAEGEDLFGTAVQMASRIAARAGPGQILVSDVVRQLAAGKGFMFSDEGSADLRGFEDPVRIYGVRT